MSSDELPPELASRELSKYLANWGGSRRGGCRTTGDQGGLIDIELRYPDPHTGIDRKLRLFPEVRNGVPVIVVRPLPPGP